MTQLTDLLLHPLDTDAPVPSVLNNPFCYVPDDLSRQAMGEVVSYLRGDADRTFSDTPVSSAFRREIAQGKMFGVLVVAMDEVEEGCETENDSPVRPRLGYLAGYSGQIGGRSDWQGFVPAVFDYLQPDGYFKTHEAEIVRLTQEIGTSRPVRPQDTVPVDDARPIVSKGRKEDETTEEYVKRRQYENAELHRWKLRQRHRKEAAEAVYRQEEARWQGLKRLRRQQSDALQRWLFSRFVMRNGRGQCRHLLDIFGQEAVPPAGSGECCEPKLLQYALAHGWKPVSMAMFWWGDSPRGEVRHHLQTYPACQGKCKPILQWMLQGVEVAPNPLDRETDGLLEWLYEDEAVAVVNKPAGMLSVEGKQGLNSVQRIVRKRYPDTDSPLVVHRLDMATSGLMIIAKTMDAYVKLQKQFLTHRVTKRYVAILTAKPAEPRGKICLPLRPDIEDRPRQMVDAVHGKVAVTTYEVIDGCRVALYPHTGRTHQLRVHCAHHEGLGAPIVGDTLYGQSAERLCLHAEELRFDHPLTGKRMCVKSDAPF